MNCPKCSAAMETVEIEKIQVDRCTGCHGLFFDTLEAHKLRAVKGSEAIDIGATKADGQVSSKERIRCPRDTSPMIQIVDPKQPHIQLETCPVCQGMFFDAGEFSDWKNETLMEVVRGWFRSRG